MPALPLLSPVGQFAASVDVRSSACARDVESQAQAMALALALALVLGVQAELLSEASRAAAAQRWVNTLAKSGGHERVALAFLNGQRLEKICLSGGISVWSLAVGCGLLATLFHTAAIADFSARWTATPHVMWMTWLMFAWLKALPETAHGVAVKRYGGRVPQWGVTQMAFTPAPFVDASAADSFAVPRQRFTVSAAGVMLELFAATLASFAALAVQPGLLRDFCWVVFVTGAVSLLFVNLNPLLRFDGGGPAHQPRGLVAWCWR